MPFNYLLTNLLVDVPGAVGTIFVDPEGEAVDWVTRHGDPYDLKVEGAYHSIFKRRIEDISTTFGGGAVEGYVVEGVDLIALTQLLPDGYYLVLVMRRNGQLGRARYQLRRAARLFARELA